jgi:hypothetical protein
VNVLARKLVGLGAAVVVIAVLIVIYVSSWATSVPRSVAAASVGHSGSGGVELTLQTVAALGPKEDPSHPDWVSYLVESKGKWVHSTDFNVPANSIVHVTVYQYDGNSGLRNPYLSQPQGTVGGGEIVDGRRVLAINPDDASHTFAVPELGVFVPLPGIPDDAKNPCDAAPCDVSSDHRTITFSFRTGRKGHFHWQCFVPCAAGTITGFGGAMQTRGYMDGFVNVV